MPLSPELPLPDGTVSIHYFMQTMKVGRPRIETAAAELGLEFPMDTISNNEAPMLSPSAQEALISHLGLLNPEVVDFLFQEGYRTPIQLAKDLGASKGSVFRHLEEVYPQWRTYPTIPQGQRRVTLLPPHVVEGVDRYHALGAERQSLATWRSMRTRGTLPTYDNPPFTHFLKTQQVIIDKILEDQDPFSIHAYPHIAAILPPINKKEYGSIKKSFAWWTKTRPTVDALMTARDIITLDTKDITMMHAFHDASQMGLLRLALFHIDLSKIVAEQIQKNTKGTILESTYHNLLVKSFASVRRHTKHILEQATSLQTFTSLMKEQIEADIMPSRYTTVYTHST